MFRSHRIAVFSALLAGALALGGLFLHVAPPDARADDKPKHRLVFHVSENDPEKMNMVLNNVTNAAATWRQRGESYAIEVVTIGPGLHMLRADTSPVKPRLKAMSDSIPHLVFSSCENTRQGMKQREGKDIVLVPQATPVPSGIVRLVELEEQGWTYARP